MGFDPIEINLEPTFTTEVVNKSLNFMELFQNDANMDQLLTSILENTEIKNVRTKDALYIIIICSHNYYP